MSGLEAKMIFQGLLWCFFGVDFLAQDRHNDTVLGNTPSSPIWVFFF
jgi:hypothetical protein